MSFAMNPLPSATICSSEKQKVEKIKEQIEVEI
jgi:hypothetical protein